MIGLFALLACTSLRPTPPEKEPVSVEPALPTAAAPFAPTLLQVGEPPMTAEALGDTARCAGCHAEIAAEWSASAHAHASFDNPWYRGSVDAFREERGLTESRFCGGCHDPVLVLAGAMDTDIHPEDPRARAGITCLSCHGASAARVEGDASLTLTAVDPHFPDQGDAPTIALHTAAMRPAALETPALCVSCHRGLPGPAMGNPFQLIGMDDGGPWRASSWGGSHANVLEDEVEGRDCGSCHMPASTGERTHKSHRFLGGQTALAVQQDDPAQLAAMATLLGGAAELGFAAVREPGGPFLRLSELPAGATALELDLVVFNSATGHTFPGGLKDTQDLWMEVELFDATGRRVGAAGTQHATEDDPSAFVFAVTVLDEAGRPSLDHVPGRFRTPAWDHTIPPRESRVIRYALSADKLVFPLRAVARLQHRRHNAALAALACEASRSARGRAFNAAAVAAGSEAFDACLPQPVLTIATTEAQLGPGAVESPGAPEQLRRHAFALEVDLQENLPDALDAVRLYRTTASTPREGALADWLEARVLARQGRTEDALSRLDRAAGVLTRIPALERVRARALARVWRWREASVAAKAWAEGTPGELAAWRDYATALYNIGDNNGAVQAAVRGLGLQPRDEQLLRVQALALRESHHARAEAAEAAWLAARGPDSAYALTEICEREVPGCADARRPVGRIALR